MNLRILVAAGLTIWAGVSLAQDAEPVVKPEPRIGDTRIYGVRETTSSVEGRIEETTISEIAEDHIQMTEKRSSVKVTYDRNWAIKQTGNRVYTPAIQAISFPLQVGKKWEHTNTYSHPSCGYTKSDLKNEVIGWEDVTVPAGTFRALRIDSNGSWRNNCGQDRLSYKFWYVPKVKWYVKTESLVYSGGRIYEGLIRELKEFRVD